MRWMPEACYDPVRLRYHGWKKWLVGPVERWCLRRCDRIVATCEAEKGWIEKYLGKRCPEIEVTDVKRFFKLVSGGVKSGGVEELSRVERVDRVEGERIDAVYADIRFVKEGESVEALREAPTVRYCSAAKWRPWMFRFAAMVPHPSFYVRRECFERLGGYSLDYRICADFELELRYLYLAKLKAVYLPECVVVMRMGGASTAGWRSNMGINREDLRALRSHGIWSCLPLIYLKYLFKIWGFVFRRG